ncbi:vacuolar ATPase assembly integral membrane protein VMA21 homolog [Chelonus insularis]|uniref:vacuolar ATPase assembly integral membrane protein VMA21 homolog n=1 Tax=Chelonus insularis TaxID=460826 RepID=UPI00158B7935|nr:vacuolar ATPase assembly integral membrane protein VMA21 homolog [Chelonus insularis]
MMTVKELPELQIFKTILYYCAYIIFLPITSFFATKIFIFDGLLGLNSIPSNVYAAIFSILVLHGALGVFIYKAYSESQSKAPSKTD